MDVSATTGTSPGVQNATAQGGGAATVSKDEFLMLFTAQLRYQNPLNPLNSTDFTSQLAQFSALEQLQGISGQLEQMRAEEEKKKKEEELAKQMAEKPETDGDDNANNQESEDDTTGSTTFKTEMDKWKRKAINAMKKGKPANVTFDTTIIPAEMCETIMTALGIARDEQGVKDAFNVTSTPEPKYESGIIALVNELKRANDNLEKAISEG